MGLASKVKTRFKKKADVDEKTKYFSGLIKSFGDPSFVGGYDDMIFLYLNSMRRKKFSENEVLEIMQSPEFKSAFLDIDRYNIDQAEGPGVIPDEEWKAGREYRDGIDVNDWFDPVYHNNYVFMMDLVKAIKSNKDKPLSQIVINELLLGGEFGEMRKAGAALHFIFNYARRYEFAEEIVTKYQAELKHVAAIEFVDYVRGEFELC